MVNYQFTPGEGRGFAADGGPRLTGDSTQDWVLAPGQDGKIVARPEAEWSWRDDDQCIQLYVLISSSGRGSKLETLNQNGLVTVDIKEHLVRVCITDVVHRITYRFQWLNFWGPIKPEESSYHLSVDNKRVVLRLQKVYSLHAGGGPWGSFLDIRTGRYTRNAQGWPEVLCEVQGTWRSEDEEPIEILGDQVIWPEGSRDFLVVNDEEETFRLVQWGDSMQVVQEEFCGIYERHAFRLKWDDGDYWTRIPGLSLKRREAGKEMLPLEYDTALSRWVPWLPPEEMRRQVTHWLPPNGAEISMEVALLEGEGLELKRELLATVEDEEKEMLIADFDYLPMQLILKCRVCALAASEVDSASFVSTMLALRDHRRVSPANEAAALGALERWFQWLRCWLAPGSRRNVDGAMEALRERLFELAKDERRSAPALGQGAAREKLGRSWDRWPPLWSCTVLKPNDLLRAATTELLADLQAAAARTSNDTALDPGLAFGDARRRIAGRLFERHQVPAGTRRCDPLERRWARLYGQQGSKSVLDPKSTRHLRRELRDGGLAVFEDALDWGTLVKIQGEIAHIFGGEDGADAQVPFHASRGGHTRWARLWATKMEELGMPGLAAASCFMTQLPARLNEWEFGKCTWSAEDPVIWTDDGEPLVPGRQPALEWAQPDNDGEDEPLGEPEEDDAGRPVPAARRILAFLFLNPPAWDPEWGGALRCHVSEVFRDVWGDGGRLVLLREERGYELLTASRSHSVLMLRLQGATITGPRAVPLHSKPRTQKEREMEDELLREIGPDEDGEQNFLLRRLETPEGYARELSDDEVRALGEQFGAAPPERHRQQPAPEEELADQEPRALSQQLGEAPAVCPEGRPVPEAVEEAGPAGPTASSVGLAWPELEEAVEGGSPAEVPELPAQKPEPEPVRLELNSHQVIQMLETCLPGAFKLD